jgi:glycosyltransferase involved in cell wall biosynthesis
MMNYDYSVIVPAYNEANWLPATLDAIKAAMASVNYRGELIVTNNNSTDATAEIAEDMGARVVFEPFNQISRARNAGAKAAHGRYLVFVDADTLITPALLEQALDNMESGGCVGGGAVVQFEREIKRSVRFVVALWNLFSRTFRLAAGCFIYCLKDEFDQAGGFSEAVYASEEIWLSRKLRKLGRPQGKRFCIIHQHAAQSSGRKIVWYNTWQQIGMLLMVAFMPFFVRSRRFCGYWYKRPEQRQPDE